jgi:hypothetical protein
MNVRPLDSVSLIRELCESCPLAAGAMLVLTCKETAAGRSKRLTAEAEAALADWWTDFHVLHLLSNGKERTLIATLRDATPQERKDIRAAKDAEAAESKAAWDAKIAGTPSLYEQKLAKKAAKRQAATSKDAKPAGAAVDAAAPAFAPAAV